MTGILKDLRYALRGIGKNRGFSAVAILSLAFGIGANTTVFTLVRALFLRPLPVRDPATIAAVFSTDQRSPGRTLNSYPNYRDLRDRNTVFSSLLLYVPVTITLTGHGDPQLLMAHLVSGNYFDTLGVQAAIGRGLTAGEDPGANGPAVAVITHALWKRLYAGDPRVLSRTIELNGRQFTIVGVAPEGFNGINQLAGADVFVPVSTYTYTFPIPSMVPPRRSLLFAVAGRLKPGIGMPQAEAALQTLSQDLEREYPRDNQNRRIKLAPIAEAAMSDRTRPGVARAGVLLMAVSGLVLLIGCGNVANLLLARAAGRQREIALRLAFGASRARLIRQLVTESLVLAGLGGLGGLVVARWSRDLLWSMRGPTFKHASFELQLDPAVFVFAFAISLLTGILFGLAPAFRATRVNLVDDLKERAGTGEASFRGVGNARSALVISQVSLALVTLIGAVLFLRSLRDAGRIDPGFDHEHLGVLVYNVNDQGYNEERGREFHQQALTRAAIVPGVLGATLSKDTPFVIGAQRGVRVPGRDDAAIAARPTLTTAVWPGYFRAIGIPLVGGRDFSMADAKASPHVAVINDTAAAMWWPGENAVGKRLLFTGEPAPVEVVGVARTVNYQNIGEAPQALVYLSLVQYYFPTAVLYVRTAGDPGPIADVVRREIQPLNRSLMLQAETFDMSLRDQLWSQRLSAGLLGVFGILALLLAVIGIYGVIAYSVRQRRREMGIRMALGAAPGDVQYMVLGEGVRLIAFGVIAGSILSLAVAGSVESMLFLKSSRDMFTFILVPAALTAVGVLACWAPARQCSHTDPSVALRNE